MDVLKIGSSYQNTDFGKNKLEELPSLDLQHFSQLLKKIHQSNQHTAIARQTSSSAITGATATEIGATVRTNFQETSDDLLPQKTDFMKAVEQALRDNMLGIDREKIDQLEKEMEAIKNDPTLSTEEKAEKLNEIQQQIDSIIKEAVERTKDKLSKEAENH